jgi:hypothetical protein
MPVGHLGPAFGKVVRPATTLCLTQPEEVCMIDVSAIEIRDGSESGLASWT